MPPPRGASGKGFTPLCAFGSSHSHPPRPTAHTAHLHPCHRAGRPRVPRASGCSLALAPIIPSPWHCSHLSVQNPLGSFVHPPHPVLMQFFGEHCDSPKITQEVCDCRAPSLGAGRDPRVLLLGRTSAHSFSQPGVCLFVFPANIYYAPGRLLGAGDPAMNKAGRE